MDGAERLARVWIEGWNAGKPYDIPLAADFSHSSPFGKIEGREKYLEWMKPMIGKGPELRIVKTLGTGDEAVIRYEMRTPAGTVACCDWVEIRDGEIAAITSFYDATSLR
jgi:hypothetical protein